MMSQIIRVPDTKRMCPVLLGLLLLAAPAAVQAQYGYKTNANNTNTITITNYTGLGGAVAIPSNINGLTVTSIGTNAFYKCTNLASVAIPSSVTNIGYNAFGDCTNLAIIAIPGTVTSIGEAAFYGCVGLTNATIANGVTSIGGYAFYFTGLTNVTIPGSVTNIGGEAFESCNHLTSVYFSGNAPAAYDSSVFRHDNDPAAYYLPGTIGWGDFSTNTDIPAVLWDPEIQTGDASFGVSNHQFGFNITGTATIPIMVEASTNLASSVWTPLQTLTLTNGSFYFSDPQWTNYSSRYYRIRSP